MAYNKHMGAVDRTDQLLESYSATKKSKKWYRKLAIHLMQVSLLNDYCLYKSSLATQDGSRPKTYLQFQNAVLQSIIAFPPQISSSVDMDNTCTKQVDKHFTSHLPPTDKKQNPTRMWANAQRDGRPAKYRWRPLFNAAKFG